MYVLAALGILHKTLRDSTRENIAVDLMSLWILGCLMRG